MHIMKTIPGGGIQQQLAKPSSPFRKYRQTMVGEKGIVFFILFELYQMFCTWLPGNTGKHVRRRVVPLFIMGTKKQITTGSNITLRRPGQISIGNNVTLAAGVTLDVKSNAGHIILHDNVCIGENTILSCPGGVLSIGRGTRIGKKCRLGSLKGLILGDDCCIENLVCIVGAGHEHHQLDTPIIQQALTCKGPGIIGNMVHIEEKSTILDGIQIGDGAHVYQGALVNRNIAPGTKVTGIPASSCK